MNLASMPKAELHLHLEGSARYSSLQKALNHHGVTDLPDFPYWYEHEFRYENFDHFREQMRDYISPWLRTPSGYAELIDEVVDAVIAQNIRYAEVNFCPNVIGRVNADTAEVLALLAAAAARSEEVGTIIRWIAGLNRDEGVEVTSSWVEQLVREPVISGFDLHGTENGWPPAMFSKAFAPVLETGLKMKVHAGEMAGPEYIREAVEDLGATQIGHGTTAIEDPDVVALLRDRGTVVEMCPSSNEKLDNVDSYAAHPIFDLESEGVTVTVSSDDALFTGIDLTYEFVRLMTERDATTDDLLRWTTNSVEAALLENAEKKEIIADLQNWNRQQQGD